MKSGFVTLIGRPNVGKSTLLNQIMGVKISITSYKPQTTRTQILGIYTAEEGQIVFIDTPGINKAVYKLDEYMQEASRKSTQSADIVLWLVEPIKKDGASVREEDEAIAKRLKGSNARVYLIINKADDATREQLLYTAAAFRGLYEFEEVLPLSAKTGEGADTLLSCLFEDMEEGPLYFPEDQLTDQPERALMAEFVREKALMVLQDEIPHGICVAVDSFSEREDGSLIDIDATIVCERESHKPIIIGKKGATIKKIGTLARREMEEFMGVQVNLKLWVKVKEHWRDSEFLIKNFGFDKKNLQ